MSTIIALTKANNYNYYRKERISKNLSNESLPDQQPGPSKKLDNTPQKNNTKNSEKMPKWFKPL